MKGYLLVVLLFWFKLAFGQLDESFSDGNFANNPAWSGSNSSNDFTVISGQLRSNSIAAGSNFYLSTTNSVATNCIWEFVCNLQFNTSGLNYTDVYLISDQADLQSANINGYFVRIGNTDDEISLYKRSGAESTSIKIIDGANGSVNKSNTLVKVKVTRTAANVFTLERDLTGTGSTYFLEGNSADSQYITSVYFGIYIKQSTATFFQKHFFDDIKITPIVTDITAPELLSARAIDSLTVEAVFNEPVDSTFSKDRVNYQLSGRGNPQSVSRISSSVYQLNYSPGMQTGDYTLTVSNVKDLSGNRINTDNSVQFNFIKPYEAKKNDIAINEIFADPGPQVDLPALEFIELWNTTDKAIQLNNWKYSDPSTAYTFGNDSLNAGEYLILCAKADTLEFRRFGRVLGISPWPSLNNSGDIIKLVSDKNITINEISYEDSWYKDAAKAQGGYTLERISPLSKCEGLYNWIASADISGGTPGRVNSVYQSDFDLVQLNADSIKQSSDTTVKVYFNKPLDLSMVTSDKFLLTPFMMIKTAVLEAEGKCVTLTYSQRFTASTEFSLSIQALKDCSGNEITVLNQPFKFTTASPPPVRVDSATIFITEIFADPSPEVGLPLAEFVEIYNPGNDTIDLSSWSLSDATTKSILQTSSILPGEQLILCPAADTSEYKTFGKVIGLSPWPSLGNTSDKIILKSFKDRTVDSVAYSDTWYKNSSKKSGGWSLERIDPLSKCTGSTAWSASTDVSGGTPGKLNSIGQKDYDLLAFHADSLKMITDSTVTIYFNKIVNQASVTAEKFILTPASGLIKSAVLNTGLNQVSLTFSRHFSPATNYSLSVQAVEDCAGQPVSGNQTFTFSTPALPPVKPVRPDTATIFITEIFADPSPEVSLPLTEFVEIYNPGNDTIDLDGWTLSDGTTKSILQTASILPGEQLILCPAADTTQYTAFGKVIGLSPWPSLGNTSDKIILKSFKDRTVDSVAYSDTWYKDSKKKKGGWSLERIDQSASGWYNWSASSDLSGGTPGKINSNNNPSFKNTALIIDSIAVSSDSTLTVYFNVIQDTVFLKASNFTVNGHAAKSLKPDNNYVSCYLEFNEKFKEGISYILSASELRTCSNVIIAEPDNQKGFSIPVSPALNYPIVINEIFADSSPVVGLPDAEFVELFNPTDQPVLLKGLSYEDATTEYVFPSGIIEAKGYLILCAVKDTSSFKPFGNVYGLNPWPGLNNDKEILKLSNNKRREFHRVEYQSDWHSGKDKVSGGWSLELINPNAVCSGKQNWTSSKDASGGTPGKSNSVFNSSSSLEPLTLSACTLQDSMTALLTFNRTIDSLSASFTNHYTVNNGVGNPIHAIALGPDFKRVILNYPRQITRGITYKITVDSISDCAGTLIGANNRSGEFFFPKSISKGDILINEILFNPRQGGTDFLEIYNNSPHELDLKDLSIATIKDTLTGIKRISTGSQFFKPGKYLALSTDPEKIKREYATEDPDAFLKVSAMPPFSDDAGVVVLVSNGIRVDEFSYSDKMHHKLIKNPDGVSLERSSFKKPSNEPGNFRSAAASSGYATPGYKNSQFLEDVTSAEEVFLSAKTFSPDNDGFQDVLQLNYNFSEAGWVANIAIYNDRGLLIKKMAKNLSLAVDGTLYWDGLTEVNEKAPVGIYVLFMEMFDLQGRVKKYRRSFVLAEKLN